MIHLGGRSCTYNILVEFGITMKQVTLIHMYLNETDSRVRVGKHLSDMFPIKNILKKKRCFIAIDFRLCFRVCH